MSIDVFDFFSGCGGTSCGFERAGMNIKFGLDFDSDSASTFRLNFPGAEFVESDIRSIAPEYISPLMSTCEGMVLFSGCAPCQPFSKQNRNLIDNDPRLNLLMEFGRFVAYWMPDFVFIENVPGMQRDCMKSETFLNFTNLLNDLGYQYDAKVVQAQWFGVPQTRTRLVLLASRHGAISIPQPVCGQGLNPYSTVREWISDFPPLSAGEVHPSDIDHASMKLSPLNIQRIIHTPEGRGRECWPDQLILDCHRGYKGHTDVYGRLAWDRPAVGLTTKCISYSNGRFGHPDQNRALSLREAASLQTFPNNFRFFGSLISKARQVGNAVPPLMAQALGQAFL
jgi:DNA (cytosine-5)-methyltransferase 1